MFGNNFNLDNRSMTSTYLTPTLAFTAFPTLFTMVQPVDPKGSRKARKMAESVVEGKGKWTAAEQRLYIAFLQHNMEDMRHKISRKSQKVFLQMSK